MPIFLASSDSIFAEKYTRSFFKMIPKESMNIHQLHYYEEIENNSNNIYFLLGIKNSIRLNNEDAFKMAHCVICDKIHINNSHFYCQPCEYYLSPNVLDKYIKDGNKEE